MSHPQVFGYFEKKIVFVFEECRKMSINTSFNIIWWKGLRFKMQDVLLHNFNFF